MRTGELEFLSLVLFAACLALLLSLDPYAQTPVSDLARLEDYCCNRAVTVRGVVLSSRIAHTNLFFTLSDGATVDAVLFNALPEARALVLKGAHVEVAAIVQKERGAHALVVWSVRPA